MISTNCSMDSRSIVIALMTIALFVVVITLFLNFQYPKRKIHITINSIVLFSVVANLAMLQEINILVELTMVDDLSLVSSNIGWLPCYIHGIFAVVVIGYGIYEFTSYLKYANNDISIISSKEAVDYLPVGLAFFDYNGFLYLSNHTMHYLSRSLFSKDLQNGLEMIRDIDEKLLNNGCVITGIKPAFLLDDNRVWQFTIGFVTINDQIFYKLQADEISDIYHLSDDIRRANISLNKERIHLYEHMKNINKYISEEETLKMKMMVHDDFGEMIAMSALACSHFEDTDKVSSTIKDWGKLCRKMHMLLSFEEEEKHTIENLYLIAKKLNCVITFDGKLPDNKDTSSIIIHAIYEMMKNAVYHAGVHTTEVVIIYENDNIVVCIKNINTLFIDMIIEGGGLKNIRSQVEMYDGKMKTRCDSYVTLSLYLPNKGGIGNV